MTPTLNQAGAVRSLAHRAEPWIARGYRAEISKADTGRLRLVIWDGSDVIEVLERSYQEKGN